MDMVAKKRQDIRYGPVPWSESGERRKRQLVERVIRASRTALRAAFTRRLTAPQTQARSHQRQTFSTYLVEKLHSKLKGFCLLF